MSTTTGTLLINKAATILFDVNNVKWSRLELLGWINDAQRALVSLLPEASSTRAAVQMVAGVRQTIPAAGWMLLDVVSNMGTNGTTRGRAVKRVDPRIFEETNPDWTDAAATVPVSVCMYNARDKTSFYVSPPSDGTGYLEIIYSNMPTDISVEANVITVTDIYAPALLDYVLFRAKSKEAEWASDPQKAAAYLASFTMYVTGDATSVGRLAAQMGALKTTPPQQQGSVGDN